MAMLNAYTRARMESAASRCGGVALSALMSAACSSGSGVVVGQSGGGTAESGTIAPTTADGPTVSTGAATSTGATPPGNAPPVAKAVATPSVGAAPLQVDLSSAGSSDPDETPLEFHWAFGDGTVADGPAVQHTYAIEGHYMATLTVVDGGGASAQAQAAVTACPSYAAGVAQGSIGAAALAEASGMAISRRSPGVLWSHNDSGVEPKLYTLTLSGAPLGVYTLQGAKLRDWEDMAIGPGPKPGQDYLYVGDIGDNDETYRSIRVYRVAEPPVDPNTPGIVASLSGVEKLEFGYPDGTARDAETLLVDPQGGDLYIVTKSKDGHSKVYRAAAPLSAGVRVSLEKVADLDFGAKGRVTGGAVSSTGAWVVVRTRTIARMWPRPTTGALWEAFAGAGCTVPLAPEPQGEAITFAATGLDYFTLSEGAMAPLYQYVHAGG